MHYVFALRGDIFEQQRLINRLDALAFQMPFTYADGKQGFQKVCGRIEPIQLFSYVFPKNAEASVLTALGGTKENRERWYGTGFKNELVLKALRKALWCKPLPDFEPDDRFVKFMPESINNLSIMPIGVKYDVENFVDKGSDLTDPKNPKNTIHEAF